MRKYVKYLGIILLVNVAVLSLCYVFWTLNVFRSSNMIGEIRTLEFFGNYYMLPIHLSVSVYLLTDKSSKQIGVLNLIGFLVVLSLVMYEKEI